MTRIVRSLSALFCSFSFVNQFTISSPRNKNPIKSGKYVIDYTQL